MQKRNSYWRGSAPSKYRSLLSILSIGILVVLLVGCARSPGNSGMDIDSVSPVPTETEGIMPTESQAESQQIVTEPQVDLGSEEMNSQTNLEPAETERETKLLVTFLDFDGTVLSIQEIAPGGQAVAPDAPARAGYSFAGWDADLSNILDNLTVNAQYQLEAVAFVVDTVSATAGEEQVPVIIAIKNNPGIASIGLDVAYHEALVLTRLEFNPELGGQFMMPQQLSSPIKLTWINPFENENGDWVFVTMYFSISQSCAPGSYAITLGYDPEDIYDISETNLDIMLIPGEIIVSE